MVLSVIIGEETEVEGGQSLSDLEASVCSNSDGQTETGARQSTLTSPSTPRPPAQPWP